MLKDIGSSDMRKGRISAPEESALLGQEIKPQRKGQKDIQRKTQQARTGRAAWGVLGSAAGGRVFVLQEETPALDISF